MRKRHVFVILFGGCLVFMFILLAAAGNGKINSPLANPDIPVPAAQKAAAPPAGRLNVDVDFGNLPLYFITNKGQVNDKAKFYCKALHYTLWLTQEGLVFDSTRIQDSESGSQSPPHVVGRDVSRLMFVGANKNAKMTTVDPAQLKVNYFKGNDKTKWHGEIPTSLAVKYENIYNNIDLKVYGIEKQVEYDWIVKPGADPAVIKVAYKNVEKTYIDKDGNLVIETRFGKMLHKKPVAYQYVLSKTDRRGLIHQTRTVNNSRESVDVKFKKLGKNTYGFVVGNYDRSRELIIDPVVLCYSTYLGTGGEMFGDIAVDNNANVYITGTTSSTDFPIHNEYQTDQGYHDVFVSRIDTNRSGAASLIYSTYLGGVSFDMGNDIAVDNSGIVYVTGETSSYDFPCSNEYQSDQERSDAFITKIDTNRAGTASLLYSTHLGGSGHDSGNGIAIDGSGCAYVAGTTYSADFPIINQYQTQPVNSSPLYSDAFVTKIDTNRADEAALLYSTYLGGSGDDACSGIAVDSDGNIYVGGNTWSPNFPCVNEYQSDQVAVDAFVSKFDPARTGVDTLIYSTYLGGNHIDNCNGFTADDSGYAYVTGLTESTDFPILGQYQSDQRSLDAFVTKIDTNRSGLLSLAYSTYLGGYQGEEGWDIAVENNGVVYVTGDTVSDDFPCVDPYQLKNPDGQSYDVIISRVDTNRTGAASLTFSTYLGGGGMDLGFDIAVDNFGYVYVFGETDSTDFPVANEYQVYQGGVSNFVAKLGPPSIRVISPNGFENWTGGSTRNITWNAPGVFNNIKITLWQGGALVGTIADSLVPTSGSYAWLVGQHSVGMAAPGADYKIKIEELGSSTADTSDAPFTMTYMSLLTPNGFENWPGGSTRNITWNAPGVFNDIKITLWQGGALVGTIADSLVPTSGSYTWLVGQHSGGMAAPGADFKIKIEEIGTAVSDESDNPFVIAAADYIVVTSANGGESWAPDSLQNITWVSGGVSNPLIIALMKNGAPLGVIVDGYDAASGAYSWQVGRYVGGVSCGGADYTIKIKEKGTTVTDKSDAFFEIQAGTLAVTSPNGGESLAGSLYHNITWDASGMTGDLYIGLLKNGALLGVIAKNIDVTTGSYAWKVGEYIGGTAVPGTDYTIGIKLKGTTTKEISDAPFEIAAPPPITVTSPNGGENWTLGALQNVTFSAPGATGLLRIILYKDGAVVGTIATNVDPDSGSIPWRVGLHSNGTALAGTGYKIKVRQRGVLLFDMSDATFTLSD